MTKIVRLCYNTSYGALFIASKILVYCLELVRIFNLLDKVFQLLSDNAGGGGQKSSLDQRTDPYGSARYPRSQSFQG